MSKYEKIKELVNSYCEKANSRVFEDWLTEMYLTMTDSQIDDLHSKIKQQA